MKFKHKLETCEAQLHTSQQHQQLLEHESKHHQWICDGLKTYIDTLTEERKEYINHR